MKNKFKFFPHTADVMFEAYGKTLEQLFEHAALATESIMVEEGSIKPKEHYEIVLETKELENLLYDFLSELIFVKDTESLLFSKFEITIHCTKGKYELFARCDGEKINRDKHKLIDDAKAITMHEFKLEQLKNNTWLAKVIVDI